jgi:hypothetical protein
MMGFSSETPNRPLRWICPVAESGNSADGGSARHTALMHQPHEPFVDSLLLAVDIFDENNKALSAFLTCDDRRNILLARRGEGRNPWSVLMNESPLLLPTR